LDGGIGTFVCGTLLIEIGLLPIETGAAAGLQAAKSEMKTEKIRKAKIFIEIYFTRILTQRRKSAKRKGKYILFGFIK